MLMEQEKFSDDMDPRVRTPNCLGVALCPARWTKYYLLLEFFLPHTFALFHRGGKNNLPSGQRPKIPLDSFLNLLCCSKMISPRVLERRESGKNLSDSVTEQSDDSSVTQDDPTPSTLLSLYTPSILRRWKKGYSKFIYIY